MKKRYQVTLTQEVADELKEILDELRLPAGIFSQIIDGALVQSLPAFRRIVGRVRSGEQLTFIDVLDEAQDVLDKGRGGESS